jgi:hypothetical protein
VLRLNQGTSRSRPEPLPSGAMLWLNLSRAVGCRWRACADREGDDRCNGGCEGGGPDRRRCENGVDADRLGWATWPCVVSMTGSQGHACASPRLSDTSAPEHARHYQPAAPGCAQLRQAQFEPCAIEMWSSRLGSRPRDQIDPGLSGAAMTMPAIPMPTGHLASLRAVFVLGR